MSTHAGPAVKTIGESLLAMDNACARAMGLLQALRESGDLPAYAVPQADACIASFKAAVTDAQHAGAALQSERTIEAQEAATRG